MENRTQLYVVYREPTINIKIKTYSLKVNWWRKTHHATTKQKKAGVAVLISSRADFRAREVIRDKRALRTEEEAVLHNITPATHAPNERVNRCETKLAEDVKQKTHQDVVRCINQ